MSSQRIGLQIFKGPFPKRRSIMTTSRLRSKEAKPAEKRSNWKLRLYMAGVLLSFGVLYANSYQTYKLYQQIKKEIASDPRIYEVCTN
mmetsp:Transcript_24496/g.28173  ORF Transcript_24496/g.28173 Transcript_24496/m.28173 type:complete len:88 (+) Transcript_24496:160-423(+)